MKKSDFNYDLPEELIAQTPIEPRDHSRLMQIERFNISIFMICWTSYSRGICSS